MTIIEIWKVKRKLYEIQKIVVGSEQRAKELKSLAQKVIAPIPWELFSRGVEGENELIRNIHIVLQTEMMLQACIFSAVSAVVAFISVVLVLFLG